MKLGEAIAALDELAARLPARPGRVLVEGHRIRVENPAARGALSAEMMAQLARAVAALTTRDDLGVIVLEGTAGSFCSGGDLVQVRAGLAAPEAGRVMCAAMTATLDALAMAPQLVVAVADGPCLGGGAELLTAADHRIFGEDARVGFVHARLGVTPGWGGAARLVRSVGPGTALRWLASGAVHPPAALGAFADVIGPLETTAAAFVDPLLALPAPVARGIKQAVLAASPLIRTPGEAEAFAALWGGPLHRDALAR